MIRCRIPCVTGLLFLLLVFALGGCGGDTASPPRDGTIIIDIVPDDAPVTWRLGGFPEPIIGTGDMRVEDVDDQLSYVFTVEAEVGWSYYLEGYTGNFYVPMETTRTIRCIVEPLDLGEFIEVPAGSFTMGSPEDQAESHEDEHPQHQVTFTRPLLAGPTEVTQKQYLAIMGTRPSARRSCDDCPVEKVNFRDAVTFCNVLSEWAGLQPPYTIGVDSVFCDWDADGYRLPTESEWEYICRAGSTTRFHFGDDWADLGDYAWYSDNSDHITHPVGEKLPNAWGFYDCHGNVFEMTWDGYFYYPEEPVTDPVRDPHNENRMARGGDFHWGWSYATSSWRGTYTPREKDPNLGFRIVRYADGGKSGIAGQGARPGRPVFSSYKSFNLSD